MELDTWPSLPFSSELSNRKDSENLELLLATFLPTEGALPRREDTMEKSSAVEWRKEIFLETELEFQFLALSEPDSLP